MDAPKTGPEYPLEENIPDNTRQTHPEFEDLQRRQLELASRHAWMMSVAILLNTGPRGWWRQWLPYWLWRKILLKRLRRAGLFDAAEYLRQNEDVERNGIDPLAHLILHGFTEARPGAPQFKTLLAPKASPDLVRMIRNSGLFDHDWYRSRNPDASQDLGSAVIEYLESSSVDPLHEPGPLFSGAYYLLENPDTRSMHPLEHYLKYGMLEGRRALLASKADAFMEAVNDNFLAPATSFFDASKETLILYWEDGNFFFTDMALYMRDYLTRRGYTCQCLTDDTALMDGDHNLVVIAPHEYCIHGPGRAWPTERGQRAVYVNTEQWHTSWFSLALGVMMQSRKVLDINPASARGLQRLGFAAGFLPLFPFESPVFSFERAQLSEQTTAIRYVKPLTWSENFSERPYDILFIGALNERREKILASLAPSLARHDGFIHCPRLRGPVNSGSGNLILSGDVAQLARNTRILLNIHQGESRYFEWHRLFVSGICEGCVVLTEPCVDTGVLEPGVHYIECEHDFMADYLDWLLLSAEGRAKLDDVRANCTLLLQRLQTEQGDLP